jgi:holo-[acyl-carrier protein] synthase
MLYGDAMIVGTGIDIAEVDRIASSIERFGRRFTERVFTADEIRYCESKANKAERYAARFAAKEAGMKAIGTGWSRGVKWRDVEVQRAPGGRPTLAFHGRAAEFFARLGGARASLSLSHTKQFAMAQVILESE